LAPPDAALQGYGRFLRHQHHRGLHRGNSDSNDQATVADVVLGHRGAIALHKERLLRLVAEQFPVSPQDREDADQRHGRSAALQSNNDKSVRITYGEDVAATIR
jgi:hypothetical protein